MPPRRPTTRAAEGLSRWCWTVTELERMGAAGLFTEYDRLELLGGEIVPMPTEGRRHEAVRMGLSFRLTRMAPDEVFVAQVPQFNLAADTFLVPDIIVHSHAIKTYDMCGADAWLVVEVADASLTYDLEIKLPIYASHRVSEYWVVNANTLITRVHRQPIGNKYGFVEEIPPDMPLAALLTPSLTIPLCALDVT
jgi:Uma2 family endonuclease